MFVTGLGVLVDVFQAPSALAGLVGIPTIGWSLLVCGLGILVAALVTSLADSMAPLCRGANSPGGCSRGCRSGPHQRTGWRRPHRAAGGPQRREAGSL